MDSRSVATVRETTNGLLLWETVVTRIVAFSIPLVLIRAGSQLAPPAGRGLTKGLFEKSAEM